jgi:hypothetical protein
MAAYEAAMNQAAPVLIGAKRTKPGTVEEAVARYLGSAAFTQQLAPSSAISVCAICKPSMLPASSGSCGHGCSEIL